MIKRINIEEIIIISKNAKEKLDSEIARLKQEKWNLELEIKGYVEHKDDLIKKYFEIKSENEKLKKERKELINTINEYSRGAMEREERELMEYLCKDEERFNDYSFIDTED